MNGVRKSAATSFASSTSLTVTAYSPGTASANANLTLSVILDPLSYDLVTNEANYPTVMPLIGFSLATLRRVSSQAVDGSATTEPYLYLPTTINTNLYDQTQNLINNQDLQIANGLYQTKTGSTTGYLNYTTSYYGATLQNLYNYSLSIPATGYRYATFCFQAAESSEVYLYVQFTINGLQQAISFQNGDGEKPMVGSSRLYFYYRVQDTSPGNNFSLNYRNTAWFDTNKQSNWTAQNYFNTTANPPLAAGNGSVFSGNTYTINCTLPQLTVLTGKVYYVYFRVCAPMNTAFSFSSVSAQFTRS